MKRYLLFAFLCCAFHSLHASDKNPVKVRKATDVDLVLESFVAQVNDYTQIFFEFNVTNTGSEDVSGFNVEVVFSEDNVIDNFNDYRRYHIYDNGSFVVPAGETVQILYELPLTKGTYPPSGTWNVIAHVNFDEMVLETDMTNNTRVSMMLSQLPPYDIELDTPPSLVNVTESSVEITYTMEEDLAEYYWLALPANTSTPTIAQVMSANSGWADGNNISIGDLAPGSEYDIYAAFVFHGGNNTRVYNLSADTQPDPVTTGVDLIISELTVTSTDQKAMHYEFIVTNNGDTDVNGFDYRFRLSTNDFFESGMDHDFYQVSGFGDPNFHIAAGESITVSADYIASSPSGYFPAGTKHVFAEINYNGLVEERYSSNNIARALAPLSISPYVIEFTDAPEIANITETSVQLNIFDEPGLREIKYLLLPAETPAATLAEVAANGTYAGIDQNTGIPVVSLSPGTNYVLYVYGAFYDGPFPNITGVNAFPFTTLGGIPVLTASTELLVFAPAEVGASLQTASYELSGEHLKQSVALFARGPFVISKDNITFSDNLEYPVSALNDKTVTIYVKLALEDSASFFTGYIAHNTSENVSDTVDRALIFNPKKSNFNGATTIAETGWNENNIAGAQVWELTTDAGPNGRVAAAEENKVLKIDGNTGGTQANEDWLITPELDLQDFEGVPTLVFHSKSVGAGQSLKLMYSTNYTSGAPSTATWTELDGKFPNVNSNQWKESRVGVQKSNNVHIAFVYYSTATLASTWLIDDWRVIDEVPASIEGTLHKAFVTYPNPTNGKVSVEWMTSPTSSTVDVRIVNAQGVVVKSFNALVKDLNQKLSDHLENTTSGIYQITIADGKRNYVTRLVKQ